MLKGRPRKNTELYMVCGKILKEYKTSFGAMVWKVSYLYSYKQIASLSPDSNLIIEITSPEEAYILYKIYNKSITLKNNKN